MQLYQANESLKTQINEHISFFNNYNKEQKYAAHERLFKLILNLSTLSLTGWIVIVAWKSDPFPTHRVSIFKSCSYLVGSLLLMCISDISIVIQSSIQEFIANNAHLAWIKNSVTMDILTAKMSNSIINKDQYRIETDKLSNDDALNIKKSMPIKFFLSKWFMYLNWSFGIAACCLFFYSVYFGVNTMTEYVADAQKTAEEKERAKLAETTPSSSASSFNKIVEKKEVSK